MKSLLSTVALWCLFVAGLIACLGSGFVLHGDPQQVTTYSGTALALVTGPLVMRKEPIRTWLSARPTLWFLFLFNLLVAVCAGLFVDGPQSILAAAGMGVVALGAGIGLPRSGRRRPVRI
ncbi:hypothetical protein [Nocardia alni]|uniref:hypothetical protein n=1 Tax=Nocardia alni TaxID=2815723 RepID=UPI001C22F913|nr:hypothetical protein [Nocardia alni]